MLLSGNFGELRPNHFHAGLILRPAGGLEVHAAVGYVSPTDGKAIYITSKWLHLFIVIFKRVGASKLY
jgi:hypothetical protein